jgi:hypothetical protein
MSNLFDYIFTVLAFLAIIGVPVILIYQFIRLKKESDKIEGYIFEHLDKISKIQSTINECKTLEEFDIVKRWAIASAENMYNEMVSIAEDTGHDEGKKLVKDIRHRLSIKEEELSNPW